jgi:hypothetical protein
MVSSRSESALSYFRRGNRSRSRDRAEVGSARPLTSYMYAEAADAECAWALEFRGH